MNQNNLRRFALHAAFAAVAAALAFVASSVTALDLPPAYAVLVVSLATAAASFFRGEAGG